MSPQMARLDEHLQRLRLNTVRERVEALLHDDKEASEKELSYADFLDGLLSEAPCQEDGQACHDADEPGPVSFRSRGSTASTSATSPGRPEAGPEAEPTATSSSTGRTVLLGPPGVGKTHLAVGLGLKAIEHGYRVLFTTAAAMLTTLTKALSEVRFDDS